jgi:hypothetical protein
MKHRYAVLLILVASTVALPSVAQSIYKCGNEYTDKPCAGGKVVVVITPEQAARATRENDAQSMLRMIRAGNAGGAREMARANNETYQFEWAAQTYQREVAQQAENERNSNQEQHAYQERVAQYWQGVQRQQDQAQEQQRLAAEARQRKRDQAAQIGAIQAAAMQTQAQIQAQIAAQAALNQTMGH